MEKGDIIGPGLGVRELFTAWSQKIPLIFSFAVDNDGKLKKHHNCLIYKLGNPQVFNEELLQNQIELEIAFRESGTRCCVDHATWRGVFDLKTQKGFAQNMFEYPKFFEEKD